MGLLQATATNVISMVGVGPFLTIPFMVAAMNGPHVIYAWIAGLVLALADGLVYAQLGAALPGSGGGYLYLREAFAPFGLGKLMAFLFIFQTILIAPLSVAGGAVGFADYLQFVWVGMTPLEHHLIAAAVCVVATALLWRNIEDIGRLAVVMLVVVLATVGWVIVAGLFTFSPAQAFAFPPEAFTFDRSLLMSVGAASVLAMYSYGGYNQVCNIGDEIKDPTRTIPRSIVLSTFLVAALYMLMTIVILGMIPWQEVKESRTVASVFIERTFSNPETGRLAGIVMTGLILFVAAASLYATILGYSRVPYAAARDGDFFKAFARVHPDQAVSRPVAGHDRDRLDPVLLLHARAAGELADPGAGAAALHLAVRGGDPAAPLPQGHPAAVHDVALPVAGRPVGRAVAVHLLHRADGRDRLLVRLPRRGSRLPVVVTRHEARGFRMLRAAYVARALCLVRAPAGSP